MPHGHSTEDDGLTVRFESKIKPASLATVSKSQGEIQVTAADSPDRSSSNSPALLKKKLVRNACDGLSEGQCTHTASAHQAWYADSCST